MAYYYIYLCTSSCVLSQYDTDNYIAKKLTWNLKEGLGWAFPWKDLEPMGINSWCLLRVLWFCYLVIFLHLICSFVMYSAWSCHFVYDVILLLVFMILFLFVSCWCLLCFEGLGNWLGNKKVDGTLGELCGTQQVTKDSGEVGACVREAKGKSMTIG